MKMSSLCKPAVLMTLVLLLTSSAPAVAQEGNAKADKMVYDVLRDVINEGAELYNPPTRDYSGCYRLYEGSLMALRPFLAHRAELQAAIDKGIKDAREERQLSERAFVLRAVIDRVRSDTKGVAASSLWNRLGGEAAVKAVVHDFVIAVAADKKIDFTRGGKYVVDAKKLESSLVDFVSMASGGPRKYTGGDMKTVHAGMGITDEQFDLTAGHLIAVLKKYKVPQKEMDELVAAVASTRDAIVEKGKPAAKSLWDRLGGEPAVKAVVHDFVVAVAGDEKIDFTRGGKYKVDPKKLEASLVDFVSMAAGGPLKYKGGDMKTVHAGMKITEDEFNRTAAHLVAVLKKYKVPQKEIDELVGAVAKTKAAIVEKSEP